jgi:hypothetical protein
MVVNDDAGNLTPRGALRFIASMLAPTGASPLAMVVNDDAGNLTPRSALGFIVGTPPGASSLLQAVLVKLVANSYNSTHGQWAFPHMAF